MHSFQLNLKQCAWLLIRVELLTQMNRQIKPAILFADAIDAAPVRLLVVLLPGHAPPLPHRAPRHPQRRRRRSG